MPLTFCAHLHSGSFCSRSHPVLRCGGPARTPSPSLGRFIRRECAQSEELPLIDAVCDRGRRHESSFHVPGHKRGSAASEKARQLLGDVALQHDLTELPGLDYLASPAGAIRDSQDLAAKAFGADHTWFLVNGTSVGIHAAVLATCRPDKCIVLARNCHQSAFAATVFAGCDVHYVQPECDEELGVAHGVQPTMLRHVLEAIASEGKQVGAVLVVSPTYFGACSNMSGLAGVCRSFGVPLIVDEAHGSHFAFDPAFPQTALAAGADVAVQSSHKTLSALTQSAMLHVRGSAVNKERLSRALQLLQSSSPSYLLMASLDGARAHAQQEGVWEQPLAASHAIRNALLQLPGLKLLSAEDPGQHAVAVLDPLRITVAVNGLGLTGFQCGTILEEQFGVVMELATQQVVVFALGIGSTHVDARQLIAAFEAICNDHQANKRRLQYGTTASVKQEQDALPDLDNPASSFDVSSVVRNAESTVGNSAFDCSGDASSSGSSSSGSSSSGSIGSSGDSSNAKYGSNNQLLHNSSSPEQQDHDMQSVVLRQRLSPRQAYFAATTRVASADAINRISAELLCPYPPGVPLAIPGEVLTEQTVQDLLQTLAAGGSVTGASDSSLTTFLVVAD